MAQHIRQNIQTHRYLHLTTELLILYENETPSEDTKKPEELQALAFYFILFKTFPDPKCSIPIAQVLISQANMPKNSSHSSVTIFSENDVLVVLEAHKPKIDVVRAHFNYRIVFKTSTPRCFLATTKPVENLDAFDLPSEDELLELLDDDDAE
ncbi:hypothetical protein PsorP6_003642 [Peronosclerospora sorghi]|uniref:Uncharacterized protein n=1 Tax=Peronosclerospora sorghi TaxID=230839 RepID=A0ACC0VM58_9STRA|nr:hypothetical protein PsorP6_003642 [Peronosclerospora sorghi]